MATRYVGAREANQQISALLKAVEDDGITVVIMRRGRSVAEMRRAEPERDADTIASRMDALFEKYSRPMSFRGGLDRDALHGRDDEPHR